MGMKPSSYFGQIDFHVLYLVVLLFIIVGAMLSFPWPALVCFIVPQFLIWTRAWDERKGGHPVVAYVLVNESVLVAVIVLNWLIYSLGFKGLMHEVSKFH